MKKILKFDNHFIMDGCFDERAIERIIEILSKNFGYIRMDWKDFITADAIIFQRDDFVFALEYDDGEVSLCSNYKKESKDYYEKLEILANEVITILNNEAIV